MAAAILLWGSALGACGGGSRQGSECSFTHECPSGTVCNGGVCVDPLSLELGQGGMADGAGGTGAGGAGGEPGGGSGGTGGVDVEEPAPRTPFASNHYRRCFDSLECAVFGGNCLTELTLSRPDRDGRERILLSDLDPSFAEGEGVCSLACTNEPRICESLVVTGPEGQSAAATCQLVFAGESPYPEDPPAFPFDHLLDAEELERGVAHASICRPPFQHAPAHSSRFCQPCAEAADCGEGDACLLERAYASTPSGSCVQPCEDAKDCPFGFTCAELADGDLFQGSAGSYCLPIEGTCGRCLDRDGDQRGVGSCGPVDAPYTEVDCDDANPAAYYDAKRPRHPFPQHCGDFDWNCNGLSDQWEQLGSPQHCSACADPCGGRVNHGFLTCVETDGAHRCAVRCDPGYADCDGDPENGCEAELEPEMLWFRDKDGDGRGDPEEPEFFCGDEEPDAGWVQNDLDCDDEDPTIYGGDIHQGGELEPAPELCDGVDNTCTGRIDHATVIRGADEEGETVYLEEGSPCDTGLHGVCEEGYLLCSERGTEQAAMICQPVIDPEEAAEGHEICNGLDDTCDGTVDEEVDWFRDAGMSPASPEAVAECQVPGGVGICGTGVLQCAGAAGCDPDPQCHARQAGDEEDEGREDGPSCCWVCIPNAPEAVDRIGDGIDSNCDGIDGDLQTAVFVRPPGDGYLDGNDGNPGTALRPVASLQKALEIACADADADRPCADVYLEAQTFQQGVALEIPAPPEGYVDELPWVRIYGGFEAELSCPPGADECTPIWRRGDRRSEIQRQGASLPFPTSYAAITGSGGRPMELLLDQVDVVTKAPSRSILTTEYLDAPTQIGIECPREGCSKLVFQAVRVEVEDALPGGMGKAGDPAPEPDGSVDGYDGCNKSTSCADEGDGDPRDGESLDWMTYQGGRCVLSGGTWSTSPPSHGLTSFQRDAMVCPDGRQPHGGNSGGWRYATDRWADVEECFSLRYRGNGAAGGGPNAGSGGSGLYAWGANGGHGGGGSGGRYRNTPRLRFAEGVAYGVNLVKAEPGTSGGGGGGGGGCLVGGDGNLYGNCNDPRWGYTGETRGGGGGAGGCGGYGGERGGHGGHAIALLLRPPSEGSLHFPFSDDLQIVAGRGGDGGQGGAGGKGAHGGWGGAAPPRGWQGGHGGNGGGGGGGAGGLGGSSVGIWRVCTTGQPGDCGMRLPAQLGAQPAHWIASSGAGVGGEGGEGGARGEKPPDVNRSEINGAGEGSKGATGLPGFSYLLYASEGT